MTTDEMLNHVDAMINNISIDCVDLRGSRDLIIDNFRTWLWFSMAGSLIDVNDFSIVWNYGLNKIKEKFKCI